MTIRGSRPRNQRHCRSPDGALRRCTLRWLTPPHVPTRRWPSESGSLDVGQNRDMRELRGIRIVEFANGETRDGEEWRVVVDWASEGCASSPAFLVGVIRWAAYLCRPCSVPAVYAPSYRRARVAMNGTSWPACWHRWAVDQAAVGHVQPTRRKARRGNAAQGSTVLSCQMKTVPNGVPGASAKRLRIFDRPQARQPP